MPSSSDPGEPPVEAASERSLVETVRSLVAGRPRPLVRLSGAALVLVGLAHLLGPQTLLWTARVGYDRALDVEFEPRESAARRVRIAGVAMVAAGAHLAYHGAVIPAERDG